MDETEYRQILAGSIPHLCPFEKSILTNCADCSQAEKHHVAEREVVACSDAASHVLCTALHDSFRRNFTFALGKLHIDGPQPHAQEMRMQCGGLKALQLLQDGSDEIRDVAGLLQLAQQNYGSMADYPYSKIVQLAMVHYKPR